MLQNASEAKEKGAPLGVLDGGLVGKLRKGSGKMVLARIRPEEVYGGLSACAAMAAVVAHAFRRGYGAAGKSSARMSYWGMRRAHRVCASTRKSSGRGCPREGAAVRG